MAADAEITLEANPGTVEQGRFAAYKNVGVTRLSIGVQSFDPQKLGVLGRIHSSEEAHRAAEQAHAAGLSNFNLDLMYALPKQELAQALADLEQAVALKPAHISHYQLTLEPNTLFAAHPPLLPEDEAVWAMQQACQAFLAGHGYAQYEISAYARPDRQARHNLNYWRFGDYLGIGAGAHGKLTDAAGGVTRLWKLKHPDAYLGSAGTPKSLGGVSQVTEDELAFEFMLNRLRLMEGFTAGEFESATGLLVERIAGPVGRALEFKLLETTADGWRVSSRGHNFLNDLQSLFLPAKDANQGISA
jgi:oxygen-independent coproporphyrinogen-3 oxidase